MVDIYDFATKDAPDYTFETGYKKLQVPPKSSPSSSSNRELTGGRISITETKAETKHYHPFSIYEAIGLN